MIFVLGHRGATENEHENTIAAFLAAAALGAHGVELDVRLSADGALVLSHDPIQPGAGGGSLPTLRDALDACRGIVVNIEIKNLPTEPAYDPAAAIGVRVAELVVEMDLVASVIVSSFDLATLDVVRATRPELTTGWLTLEGYEQMRALGTAQSRGHTLLLPQDRGITAELVAAAHDAGMRIGAWTVNDPDRMRQLASWGVDYLITDKVSLALSVLFGSDDT